MSALRDKFAEKLPALREELKNLIANHGNKILSTVSVAQLYGGLRGTKGLVCDTSLVEPDKGLIIRGFPIAELTTHRAEDVFFLLVTGELPTADEASSIHEDNITRKKVPEYIWNILKAMPLDTHPMVMLSTAVLSMQKESQFAKAYEEGAKKTDYWEHILEDSTQILSKLPIIAAWIYRTKYQKGDPIPPDASLDWGADFARMLGMPDPEGEFQAFMRLFLVLHCDHEGGNVSAYTSFTVSSALSDPYYSVSAGLNGLAGPLHGLANQECLKFVLEVREKYNGVPSDEQLKKFCWETLNSGQVIPGYGHAVLRCPDPRFVACHKFGKRVCPNDEVFKIVDRLYAIVPNILKEQGKAKNPWPNVDAGSGSLLYHFGITEFEFYTVFFGVSRAMGLLAQQIINRALGIPINRPKSVTSSWVKDVAPKL